MKNKKTLAIITAIVLLLVTGGAFFVMNRNASSEEDEYGTLETELPTLSPEDIGLTFDKTFDNKRVKFTLTKTSDIQSLEFNAIYAHDKNPAENIFNRIEIEEPGEIYESKFYDLGTCSATCTHHTGVKEVNFTFTITKLDGKQYSVADKLSFE